ncbi:PspC domain-containing protein [Mucilaginibacter terrae]|uniref:PspC domain-containing protein n=1 Tax=Mucilaginibacter terrae TaxID=1955052 RepID=UPI003641FAD3
MNKTIIININGTVFHIEEQAYELLKEYMTDVKRHFFNSADSLEITTDIENRIAEMFTEILARENRQAIVDQDVAEVIEQMGSVKDFEFAEENGPTGFAEPAYTHGHSNRRLFRDPDDHLIGGVCAGIAKYFDVQAVWIRLAFALAFTLAGTGFFLYIILLLIIPKAATRADRMAMKGEPLDLQGFKRNFEAELSTVGGRLNDLRHEARPLVYRTRDFISDFFHHLGIFIKGSGKVIVKLLGIAIILSCIGGVIAVIVALVATWVFGEPYFSLPDNFFNYRFVNQVMAAVALLAIIPLTTLIVTIASAVFNTTSLNRSAGFTLLIIWISALVIFIYHGSRVAVEFRESAGFTQTINIKPNAKQVYYLQMNETMFLTAEDSSRLNIKTRFKNMVITDDDNNGGIDKRNMNIDIERSDVAYPVLVEEFTSRGSSYENALSNARNTRYVFNQQDSVLRFDTRLRRLNKNQWHNEEVRLTLRIPLNATIVVNHKVNQYISNYLDIDDCSPGKRNHSSSDTAPFVMTDEGLKCPFAKDNDDNNEAEAESTLIDTTTVDTVSKIDTTVVVTTRKIISPRKK